MARLTVKEAGTAPPTPASGYVVFYAKTDGQLYFKDDTGIEFTVKGGASLADLDTITKMNANFTDGTVLVDTADILLKAGGQMSGNITMAGAETVDGRDLSVDGTKLDGIEALADVTDATNVAAAGAVMDSDISEADGFLRKTGAGAYEAIKCNLIATAAPTATDDSAAGYAVGSIWIDVTNDLAYTCVDATAAAAIWSAGGGSGTGLSGDYINANTNAVAGTHYQVDTTGGAVTLTLPASPDDGDYISLADVGGQAGTNFITVGRNGNTIDGAAADGAMVSSGMFQIYIWDGANTDWKSWSLTPHPDPGGGGGLTVEFKTASFTAVAGKKYKVDTSGGAVTVTLPAGTNLDNIVIQDVGHVAETNNITVNPNGAETIDGDTTYIIDQNDGDIDIGYNSGTTDWEVSADGTPDLVNVDDYVAGTQSIFIHPYDLSQVSGETTRVQVTNSGTAIDAINFPASAGYHWATWAFTPETRWALNSNFRFRVFWFPSNTDTGNVQFGMYNGATLADGDDLGTSWDVGNGVALEDEAQGLATRLSVSAWTAWNSMNLSFARDNLTLLRFQRNKNEAADTHTGDMRVVLIEIQWISDASNND